LGLKKRDQVQVFELFIPYFIYAGNTKEADVALELSTKQSFFEIGDNISPSIDLG